MFFFLHFETTKKKNYEQFELSGRRNLIKTCIFPILFAVNLWKFHSNNCKKSCFKRSRMINIPLPQLLTIVVPPPWNYGRGGSILLICLTILLQNFTSALGWRLKQKMKLKIPPLFFFSEILITVKWTIISGGVTIVNNRGNTIKNNFWSKSGIHFILKLLLRRFFFSF